MKILQLVTKRQYRGAEVFAANLSKELIGLGHEIVFAGLYHNEKEPLVVPGADNLDLSANKKGRLSLSLIRNLAKLIKNIKPDIIQCNGSDTLKYMIAASFLTPRTPIIYRNISIISKWIPKKEKRLLYNQIFKRVDHVTSVGSEALEDFINTLDYPAEKTSVIRRGIPISLEDSSQSRAGVMEELNIKPKDKIVVHIGNFSPEKNHLFLVDIFGIIKRNHTNIKLICAGDGLLFNKIKGYVREKDLEDTIFLIGFRKEISKLLAGADCLVLTSLVEGVPGVILEAASQKKPSISTNVGGVSEVLIHNKTGFLVNDFNKEEFAGRILEILQNDELNKRLGNNAFDLVLDNYSTKSCAEDFDKLYRSLNKNH